MSNAQNDEPTEERKMQPEDFETLRKTYGNDVTAFVAEARTLEVRTPPEHRRFLIGEVASSGLQSDTPASRRAVVEYLVEHLRSEQADVRAMVERVLQEFRKDDFSDPARAQLRLILEEQPLTVPLCRIAGIAEEASALPKLEAAAAKGFAERTVALKTDVPWNAALAATRIGAQRWQANLEDRLAAEPDVVQRATLLFRDLGYTKSQASFDRLAQYLESDVRLPTLKPTQAQGEREAAHAARVIVAHVTGGPNPEGLTDDELVAATKQWAANLERWPIWR